MYSKQLDLARRLGFGRLIFMTQEAVVAADLEDQRIVIWNEAATRMFGWPVEEALGMPLVNLVPEELREAHLSGLARYRSGAEPALVGREPAELPAMTRSGERIAFSLTLNDVQHADARRYVLAIGRDVTAQRMAHDALAEANRMMEEFVANASHDLRTPLTSIVGFSHLLLESDDLGEKERREFVEIIARSAGQASRLVDDLLTISRIQSESVEADPTNVRLAELVRVIRGSLEADLVDGFDPGLTVWADPDHLQRMMVNLITNAQKYGEPPISVEAEGQGTWVEVRVRDRGPGVPEKYRERLFERFSHAGTEKTRGTGLGLSIVKGLAQANGGELFYRPGDPGSVFGLRLPAKAEAVPEDSTVRVRP